MFNHFLHVNVVRNICKQKDLSDDICHHPFCSQLLPLQVRVLHNIFHNIITLKKGHTNEVTHLGVGLLDCIFRRRLVNLRYVIMRHVEYS